MGIVKTPLEFPQLFPFLVYCISSNNDLALVSSLYSSICSHSRQGKATLRQVFYLSDSY